MSVVGGGQTGTFGNKFSVPITGMSTICSNWEASLCNE
jgi:hypothetical protein